MIRSLYGKFALSTLSIMLVSGLLSFFISNTYYHQVLKAENDEKNTRISLEIVEYLSAHNHVDLEKYLSHVAAMGYQLYVLNEAGEERFFGESYRDDTLSTATVASVLDGNIYHGMKNFPRETFVTGFFANELRNTIGVPFEHRQTKYALFLRPDIKLLFNEVHILLAVLLGLTVLFSILLVMIVTRFMVKPITALTGGTRSIADGNLDVRLDIDREDELGELASSFNKMTARLQQIEHMRSELMNNISHDIQSPLANIKGYAHLLQDTPESSTGQKYLRMISEETDRLSHLTEQLVLISSLRERTDMLRKTSFNVAEQIKGLVRRKQWMLSEKEIMVTYTLPATEIIGDEVLLLEVWENLLSNAIKYNRVGGSIDIVLEEGATEVEITLSDTGIGLTSTETERIFERFYRADPARERSVQGSGLGLTIVRMIVDLHNGSIDIHSRVAEGTSVTVSLSKP